MTDDPAGLSVALASTGQAVHRRALLEDDEVTESFEAIDASGAVVGVLTALHPMRTSALGDRFEALCRAAMAIRTPSIVPILEVVRGPDDAPQCLLELDGGAPFVAALALASRQHVLPPRAGAQVVLAACAAARALGAHEALAHVAASLDVSCLRIDREARTRIDPARAVARALVAGDARPDAGEAGAVRALGAMLYTLTTGASPSGSHPAAPGELVAPYPDALDDAIMAALRAAPGEGLSTLDAWTETLSSWLEPEDSDDVARWLDAVLTRVPKPSELARPPSLREGLGLGRVLDHKYRLDRVIGSGGMGVVFAATHVSMRRVVAVKVLTPAIAGQGEIVMRFLREARIAGALTHPGLAPVYDVGEDHGAYYLVMELLEGETLRALLDREGPLSVERALSLVLPLASALAFAHERGVVHRDLKPDNVFLSVGRETSVVVPKLLDFGISKPLDEETVTLTGAIVGTPLYLAPEQIRAEPVDPRTDVYQLGALLFEMLAGGPPYEAQAMGLLLLAISQGDRASLRVRAPHVPAALADVIEAALALRMEDRPASVQAFARRIAAVEAGDAATIDDDARTGSSSNGASPTASRPVQRRWPLAVGGALTGAAVGIAAGWMLGSPSPIEVVPTASTDLSVRFDGALSPLAETPSVLERTSDQGGRCEVMLRRDGEAIDVALRLIPAPPDDDVVAAIPPPAGAEDAAADPARTDREMRRGPLAVPSTASEPADVETDDAPVAGAMRVDDF